MSMARLEVEISRKHLQGHSQAELAKLYNVTPGRICQILGALRKRWRAEAVTNYADRLNTELQRLSMIEQEAWAAWERSCQAIESTTKRKEVAPVEEPVGSGQEAVISLQVVKLVREKSVKQGIGDAKFLDKVESCILTRLRLMGALSPDNQVNLSIFGDVNQQIIQMTPEQQVAALKAIKDQYEIRMSQTTPIVTTAEPVDPANPYGITSAIEEGL